MVYEKEDVGNTADNYLDIGLYCLGIVGIRDNKGAFGLR